MLWPLRAASRQLSVCDRRIADTWRMPRLTDARVVRAVLETDRNWAVYPLGDLAPELFEQGEWYGQPTVPALLLLFRGFETPVLITLGPVDAVRGLLDEMGSVPRMYLHVRPEIVAAVRATYRVDHLKYMWRMILDRGAFRPARGRQVVRLGEADVGALQRLYAHGGAAGEAPGFFAASMVAQGVYFGVHEGTELVAAGGTHLVSMAEGVAAIGNVYTRRDRRGHGLGADVTSAVTSTLLDMDVRTVALNVNQQNELAERLYSRLGFVRYAAFCEGVAERTSESQGSE
jgi:ribosomal protein S18 acetylase RimI-like enzyme